MEAVAAIRRLKRAGIQAGLIVLLGNFGKKENRGHIIETAKTLNAMKLKRGDFLYFSPHQPKGSAAPDLNLAARQFQGIKNRLKFGPNKPVLALYDIREFVV